MNNTRGLLILSVFIMLTSCLQPTTEDMGGATQEIKSNLSSLAFGICVDDVEENFTLFHYEENAIIIARNKKPFMLIATYDFDLTGVPKNLMADVLQIKAIKLQSTFFSQGQNEVGRIPSWIANFKALEYLTLESAYVNSFSFIESSNLRCLVLINTQVESNPQLEIEIALFNKLTYVVCNECAGFQDTLKSTEIAMHVTILTDDEFQYRIETGDLRFALD